MLLRLADRSTDAESAAELHARRGVSILVEASSRAKAIAAARTFGR